MAKVWFSRRQGANWIVPGGKPAYELPLSTLIFPLDLGTHRRVPGEDIHLELEIPAEEPTRLERVFVEVKPEDLVGQFLSGYSAGHYDSPYSPAEVGRRLASQPRRAGGH